MKVKPYVGPLEPNKYVGPCLFGDDSKFAALKNGMRVKIVSGTSIYFKRSYVNVPIGTVITVRSRRFGATGIAQPGCVMVRWKGRWGKMNVTGIVPATYVDITTTKKFVKAVTRSW